MDSTQRAEVMNKIWGDGVETHCAAGVLNDLDVAHLLVILAEFDGIAPCGKSHCQCCAMTFSIWWDLFDDLSEALQTKVVSIVERMGFELPERRNRTELYRVVPTAQR